MQTAIFSFDADVNSFDADMTSFDAEGTSFDADMTSFDAEGKREFAQSMARALCYHNRNNFRKDYGSKKQKQKVRSTRHQG